MQQQRQQQQQESSKVRAVASRHVSRPLNTSSTCKLLLAILRGRRGQGQQEADLRQQKPTRERELTSNSRHADSRRETTPGNEGRAVLSAHSTHCALALPGVARSCYPPMPHLHPMGWHAAIETLVTPTQHSGGDAHYNQ